MFDIDPIHEKMDMFNLPLTQDVWRDKYRWKDERTPLQTFQRVAEAIYQNETDHHHMTQAFEAMSRGLWVPGGRITAGAGTEKRVTLMNCYVNATLDDSMEGIMQGNTNVALTLQQSGGIGTDFSTLRPSGALLRRTHSKASGPLPFMRMVDSTSATVRSAGDRRGAMMGTMCDTHPDLPLFIVAKRKAGELTQFNISVLVSDAFMEAVKDDEDWVLHFSIPPVERAPGLAEHDFEDDNDVQQYAYSIWKARDLWKMITENTYEYSEPGIIFIDRINELNNLYYCEQIRCTNPCGEQPLPPHGTCNLGHINLARMVRSPFTKTARFDFELCSDVARMGTRFLDNVIDVTDYPLPEQRDEEYAKRRLGMGITGLADALVQLDIRYGSHEAAQFTEKVMETVCCTAYETSCDLAKERGSFPMFDAAQFSKGKFVERLPVRIYQRIHTDGIRNSHLLTIAPVGTGAILFGHHSSGLEPFFDLTPTRAVFQHDESWKKYTNLPMYGLAVYHEVHGLGKIAESIVKQDLLPSVFVTADDLNVHDHVIMQASAQRWIDASVSKTINCPKDMSYEEFANVYDLAYQLGCKGCTTYRPSEVRGSVLSKSTADTEATTPHQVSSVPNRPDTLAGRIDKIRWPSLTSSLYITTTYLDSGQPFEVFFNSKDARAHDWMTALSLMISAILRKGGDVTFICDELEQVVSLNDGAFFNQKHYPSLPSYIGAILRKRLEHTNDPSRMVPSVARQSEHGRQPVVEAEGERCPRCQNTAFKRIEGCKTCQSCGFSTCG